MEWLQALPGKFWTLLSNIGAFIAGFFVGKLKEEKEQAEERADIAEKKLEIANRPRKHGKSMLGGLRKRP